MNTKGIILTIAFSTLVVSAIANAHAPEEHMKEAQSPDCAAMSGMDKGKMDMDDPVMQAMMKQCMNNTDESELEHKEADHKTAMPMEKNSRGEHSATHPHR